MKRREFIFAAGKPLPQQFRDVLSECFDPRDVEMLEKNGGRVIVSVATPSPSARRVDRLFVRELEYLSFSPDKIMEIVKGLKIAELKKLSRILNVAFNPDRIDDTRGELVRHFLDPQRFRTRIEEK